MKYFVFDTETTGLYANDEVIQFSGLLFDENKELLDVVNFYCNSSKLIPKEVEAVHGLSNKVLNELSGGLFFEDKIMRYPWLYNPKGIVFIGYNVAFDIKMVNNTLSLAGYERIDFGQNVPKIPAVIRECDRDKNYNICLMKTLKDNLGLKSYAKLEHLANKYVSEKPEDLAKLRKNIIDYYKLEDNKYNEQGFHDSLFDSIVTVSLFRRFGEFYY
ncbi:3'-5' exonuclease [Paraclostridium bifermentans]|uniref:3'-5' exonuclease n=1 Tax=Paraclostridium bifermentans TaxID=1490 RepID=UPI00374E665F